MNNLNNKAAAGLVVLITMIVCLQANAITQDLWVGQSYVWDFGNLVMGSTYNMSVTTSGGYLSVTGSGFYRKITPTQYFSGTATVTAEWDETLYYGGPMKHQRFSVSIECRENRVIISDDKVILSPGETYQLRYDHKYNNNPYVGAANVYFSGGNSHFTVTSDGLITAISPGDGYVNLYSNLSSAANAPYCHVIVKDVEPTGATTGNYSVLADQSTDLKVNVSPSNATVKSTQWYIKSGADVVSISGSRLTGLKPGSAVVYCMVNDNVRSNDAEVTVTEPKLTISQKTPAEGSTGVSVFATPSITFSHSIFESSNINAVSLTANGNNVGGTVEIAGREIRFLPSKPLQPLTEYILSVPGNAVENKWHSHAQNDMTLTFKTGELETATLEFKPSSGSYISSGETVKLEANPTDAKIYYTLDGSKPTCSSKLYVSPIKIASDVTINAFAIREGYKDSDIMTGDFFKSQSEVVEYYPNDNSPMFNYGYANPYLMLSGAVVKSNNFRRISLKKSSGEDVVGSAYLAHNLIVFVPDEPLGNTMTYTLDIPYDAIKTENGEVFKGFNWSFSTPNMPMQVGMQGDETLFLLSENGQVMSRGMQIKSSKPSGEISYENYGELTDYASSVTNLSCGYLHHTLLDNNFSPIFKGLNYCGELGDKSFSHTSNVRLSKAGFQTSAIICEDNTLWMAGRNDFYQLCGNDGTHSAQFIKVADNVIDVALGNGYTLYVDTDNVLWAIGRNHMGQLGDGTVINRETPVKIMDGVEKVFASSSGFFAACITTDHELYTWGDNSSFQLGRTSDIDSAIPKKILSDVYTAALGESHGLALTSDFKLYSWGNNAFGQAGTGNASFERPQVMAENVLDIDAGPHTSLILYVSGKVTGWGRKTNSNFGSGSGNAMDFVVNEGRICSELQGATLVPDRFEIKPQSAFAFSPIPQPLTADYENVEWSSENPGIASVDGNGIISSGKLGETIVTAKFTDRYGNIKEAHATVVCTDTPKNTGISTISPDERWTVSTTDSRITVKNADIGATYSVYNLQGIMVAQAEATTSALSFEVRIPDIYVVKSGKTAVKVYCK